MLRPGTRPSAMLWSCGTAQLSGCNRAGPRKEEKQDQSRRSGLEVSAGEGAPLSALAPPPWHHKAQARSRLAVPALTSRQRRRLLSHAIWRARRSRNTAAAGEGAAGQVPTRAEVGARVPPMPSAPEEAGGRRWGCRGCCYCLWPDPSASLCLPRSGPVGLADLTLGSGQASPAFLQGLPASCFNPGSSSPVCLHSLELLWGIKTPKQQSGMGGSCPVGASCMARASDRPVRRVCCSGMSGHVTGTFHRTFNRAFHRTFHRSLCCSPHCSGTTPLSLGLAVPHLGHLSSGPSLHKMAAAL